MVDGRTEENTRDLLTKIASIEQLQSIEKVNIDMWKPYIKVLSEIIPQTTIVRNKFHLFKKLSEAIDKNKKKRSKNKRLTKTSEIYSFEKRKQPHRT